jgi:hypothetical protein
VINDKVECYLIEQGKEEEKLKELLKRHASSHLPFAKTGNL